MGSDVKEVVKVRYGKAAQKPEAELCCPTDYDRKALTRFIPEEVLGISYGCGTPAGVNAIRPGEAVLDIGSGGGIDCFIASEKVGARGHVIGIDMTDEMLEIARRNAPIVARNLGYPAANVDFRKGDAEKMPVEDASVDVIISNCVINLSPHKERVFGEMFRVLRPGGRFTVSDIVADSKVPRYLQNDTEKWGACLTGALTVRGYMEGLWQAGFRGLVQEKFFVWKKIDGIHFLSVTLTGYKLASNGTVPSCYATLKGPFSQATDEEGRVFERGRPLKISGRASGLFSLPSYGRFFVSGPEAVTLSDEDAGFSKVLPAREVCFWKGDYAFLAGPFREAYDDDAHCYRAGEPVEICSKTARVLNHKAYQDLFCIFNRTGQNGKGTAASCDSGDGAACC